MICRHQERNVFRVFPQTTLYECRGCGFVFIDELEKKPEPKVLYEEYYKNETGGRFNFGIEYVIRMFRFFRAFKIFTVYPQAKTILDIGSGRGFMLYYLKKYYGYRVAIGTQLSKNALEFSRKKLGLKIFDRDFLELSLEGLSFDVVTIWHVLEHVPHPDRYIEKANQILNKNGKLVIEVPNLDSWTARFTGRYWLGLDLKYHLYFFSPLPLLRLLKKHNFNIRNVHTFSLEYSIFISAQSIVSFLTNSDHLLFEWLQTGKFRPIIIWHIFLFLLLLPACFLINVLLLFSKKGEVLLIVAEKGAPNDVFAQAEEAING